MSEIAPASTVVSHPDSVYVDTRRHRSTTSSHHSEPHESHSHVSYGSSEDFERQDVVYERAEPSPERESMHSHRDVQYALVAPPPRKAETTVSQKIARTDTMPTPDWPWEVVGGVATAAEQAAFAATGNLKDDNARIVQGVCETLARHMPTRMPAYSSTSDSQRRAMLAHENDGSEWRHALTDVLHAVTEQLDRATGRRTAAMREVMSEMERVERVAETHAQRVQSLDEPLREQGMRVLRSRVSSAMAALREAMNTRLREELRSAFAATDRVRSRGMHDPARMEDKGLRTVLGDIAGRDDSAMLGAMDAVRAHHNAIVRGELDRWYAFFSNYASTPAV